jgi:hypothetical protein
MLDQEVGVVYPPSMVQGTDKSARPARVFLSGAGEMLNYAGDLPQHQPGVSLGHEAASTQSSGKG